MRTGVSYRVPPSNIGTLTPPRNAETGRDMLRCSGYEMNLI